MGQRGSCCQYPGAGTNIKTLIKTFFRLLHIMTCVYPPQLAQTEAYSLHSDMCYIASNYYRPLPSVLISKCLSMFYCSHTYISNIKGFGTFTTDFFAETMCGLLPLHGPRRTAISNRVLPELLFFIGKVTTQAGVNVHVAVVALIYIYRLKRRLRKDMVGGYGKPLFDNISPIRFR